MSEIGTSATYKRLRQYAKPYWGLIAVGMLGMALEAAASAGTLKLLGPIVDNIFVEKNFSYWLPAGLVLLLLARGLFGLVADYTIARSGRGVARDLRMQLMDKYLRLPGARFDTEPVPSMLTRLGADSEQVAQAAVDALKVMVSNTLGIIATLGIMFWTSWRVSLVLLLLAPVMAWMMGKVGKRYRRLNHSIQESAADMLQTADQALNAQQDVKAYGAQPAEMARYGVQTLKNLRLALKIEVTRGTLSMLVQGLGAVGVAVMLVAAGMEAQKGRLTAGDFMTLMTAMVSLVPMLRQLTNVQSMLQRGISSADRLFSVMDAPSERDEGMRPLQRAQGLIEFKDVDARYEGQDAPALHGISFIAKPGTVTAIVGRSGSGKSTLVKLIPRFYEAEHGQILLDGQPLADYPLQDLRRQIAIVGQQVMLFDGSVADNVAYGELQDAARERIDSAVRDANAMEFVAKLPEGVDTHIGAKGGKLSGGQRQRLAIARAMLKDAPILILDEATAALDNESERLVQDALAHLIPDRTTLVIAHRLSTIEHADQVLVLDGGRLVEQGTHAELLARGGLYAHLHAMQFREGNAAT
ncbi:lipid A export permease/ATP-binding protein MsbA [Thermomonas sp. HDW16]|uniref:lipid A export permease/ATP-binding protein MsbA n=1 Tax=Thermomonas sp. HDW16 TaxID=2714945 RepID=UPI001408714A|nr:lipid A export permease/ATP-binding protein MsbA [Thermomonas sp. HDW16]QIL20492.1 lipid A export permease/ATP-binding protein MsbA [Thermomonas sp. HDW16]